MTPIPPEDWSHTVMGIGDRVVVIRKREYKPNIGDCGEIIGIDDNYQLLVHLDGGDVYAFDPFDIELDDGSGRPIYPYPDSTPNVFKELFA